MEPFAQTIAVAVQTIVDEAHPRRIILFGSAARGEAHEGSDIDLLVVMPDGAHRRNTARALRRRLGPLGRDLDLVVATENDLKAHGDNFSMIYYPALREGRVIYAA